MTVAERLLYSTLYIESHGDGWSSVGTGFAVVYQTDSTPVTFVVTNKHVIEGAKSVSVRAIVADAVEATPTRRATRITIEDFSDDAWFGHSNPDVDVAIIPLNTIVNAMSDINATPFILPIGSKLFLTNEDAEQLDVIEDVLFIGHPNGLYDSHSFLPVTRQGITATPLQNDYQGKPAFLIDASIFPGSSGSPVFI